MSSNLFFFLTAQKRGSDPQLPAALWVIIWVRIRQSALDYIWPEQETDGLRRRVSSPGRKWAVIFRVHRSRFLSQWALDSCSGDVPALWCHVVGCSVTWGRLLHLLSHTFGFCLALGRGGPRRMLTDTGWQGLWFFSFRPRARCHLNAESKPSGYVSAKKWSQVWTGSRAWWRGQVSSGY